MLTLSVHLGVDFRLAACPLGYVCIHSDLDVGWHEPGLQAVCVPVSAGNEPGLRQTSPSTQILIFGCNEPGSQPSVSNFHSEPGLSLRLLPLSA